MTATKSEGTFEARVRKQKQLEADLLIRKQQDYGPKNIAGSPGGPLNGINVRQWDKVSRADNLLGQEGGPQYESLRDTYVDQANYGTIGTLVLDGFWPGTEAAESSEDREPLADWEVALQEASQGEFKGREIEELRQAVAEQRLRAERAEAGEDLHRKRAEKAQARAQRAEYEAFEAKQRLGFAEERVAREKSCGITGVLTPLLKARQESLERLSKDFRRIREAKAAHPASGPVAEVHDITAHVDPEPSREYLKPVPVGPDHYAEPEPEGA